MRPCNKLGLSVFALLFFPACFPLPSLYPVYEPGQTILDARLEGNWQSEDGEATLSFGKADGSYQVTLTGEDDQKENLLGHLVRVGDHLILDLTAPELDSNGEEERLLILHLLPVHTFYRVRFDQGQLVLAFLDDEWTEEMVGSGKIKISHARIGDRVVLTAPPARLQKLIRKYGNSEDAFNALGHFKRVGAKSP